jgi:predicted transcriptional regulator
MTKTVSKPIAEAPRKATRVAEGKPARMVRKQILLTPEQSQRIKALAMAMGRTEAELFREAIDARLASVAADNQAWKAAWLAAAGMWAAYPEIDEKMAIARSRRRMRHERLFGSKD